MYKVTYTNGVVFYIDWENYCKRKVFNGLPLSFLKYVEHIGDWKTIEKIDGEKKKDESNSNC